ncbi:MAG: hypothetical protein AB1746_11145 [Candidatus Zixiibacteriota bacterium]
MKSSCILFSGILILVISIITGCSDVSSRDVVRPEEIKSRRQVIYDQATYAQLAGQWQEYYKAYPSEYAYANWMRAADYAEDSNLPELLDKGLEKYPANPVLLYLKALIRAGKHNDLEARGRLERAAALDPEFIDPWFLLVTHYMDARDDERLDVALRHILDHGAITDETYDFNYNIISTLEPDAILITNGDNDTYPGWILTRIEKYRPDVAIVNRSLLNTDWYPLYVIEKGLPRYIEQPQLNGLRSAILDEVGSGKKVASCGIFSDTLIQMIVESATKAGRPVYFAKTVEITPGIKKYAENGRDLGLAILVTPSSTPYEEQLNAVFKSWLDDFRVGGLQSWRLQNSPASDGGRSLMVNYAYGIAANLETIKKSSPQLFVPLFDWYIKYVAELIPQESQGRVAYKWCQLSDVKKINDWCKKQGIGN